MTVNEKKHHLHIELTREQYRLRQVLTRSVTNTPAPA